MTFPFVLDRVLPQNLLGRLLPAAELEEVHEELTWGSRHQSHSSSCCVCVCVSVSSYPANTGGCLLSALERTSEEPEEDPDRWKTTIRRRAGVKQTSRYHFFRTDPNPIPKILSICWYRYRSDTNNSEYLPIPISIRYQKFWVSAHTDINPIPTILSICRYRYQSDTKNSEYLPIPISIRYQKF